jgi:hypothetical protein
MTKILSVTVLVFFQMLACVHKENEFMPTASPNVAIETPSPEPSRTVLKEGGWQIPGLKNSVVGKRIERKSENNPKVSVTKYVPGYVKGKPPRLEPSFFTDEERRILRLFPSDFDLVVLDIWVYDVQEKIFCYQVHVHPQGIGATTILYFYDTDGDERFETVKTHSGGFRPELPDWVK